MNSLYLPNILPEELGIGYLSFLASVNDLTERELIHAARQNTSRERWLTTLEIVAELAKIEISEFINEHTNKPFYNAFLEECHYKNTKSIYDYRQKNDTIRLGQKSHYCFCHQCADEDLKFWGRSYWRRTHQIDGICWCSKHHIPLKIVHTNTPSLQPHKMIDLSDFCLNEPFPNEDSVAGRYQQITNTLLDLRRPVYLPFLTTVLKILMRKEDYSCWSASLRQRLVSDTVLDSCPTEWCHELFDDFSSKERGRYFRNIDAIEILCDDTPIIYVLALSVLCDDPDHAANIIVELSNLTPRNRTDALATMKKLEQGDILNHRSSIHSCDNIFGYQTNGN